MLGEMRMEKLNPYIGLAGRILIALMYVGAGVNFIGDYGNTAAFMESKGVPGFLLVPTIILVVVGGLSIILGWKTRFFAFLLAGFTLIAGIIFHNDLGDPNEFNHFMKNLSIVGAFLYLLKFGAGELSLDNRNSRDQ